MKRSRKSQVLSKPKVKAFLALALLAIGLLGYIFMAGEHGCLRLRHLAHQVSRIKSEIEGLKLANEALDQEIESLKTDPLYIERIAREELGMIRPGEMVYEVVPSDTVLVDKIH